jgi:hypothetical protein
MKRAKFLLIGLLLLATLSPASVILQPAGIPFGAALPGTCTVGQVFFLTTATAGFNLYRCTALNVWTPETPNVVLGASSITTLGRIVTATATPGTVTEQRIFTLDPATGLVSLLNTDFSPGLEFRPGGIGLFNTFIGVDAGAASTSGGSVGFGFRALQYNTGNYSNGFGTDALTYNSGEDANGFGDAALNLNSADHATGFGTDALGQNNGVWAVGFGAQTLFYNNWPSVLQLGIQTTRHWTSDAATDQAFAFADVDGTAHTITFGAPHGFGTVGGKVNLLFTQTGGSSAPGGMVSATIYQFDVTSPTVLTLAIITDSGSADFTGKLTNSVDITNSIAVGVDANATKPNQVVLGPASITETVLRGNLIGSPGGTVPAWALYALLAIANGVNGCANPNGCWQVNGVLGANKAAGLTQDVVLFQLPVKGKVSDWRIKTNTACTGTATANTGLGVTGSNVLFRAQTYDIQAAPGNTNLTEGPTAGAGSGTSAAINVVASLITTVNNVDQLVAGCALDFDILWSGLP